MEQALEHEIWLPCYLKYYFQMCQIPKVPADTPAAIRFAPKPYVNPQALLMTVGTSGSPEKPVRFPMYDLPQKQCLHLKQSLIGNPPLQTAYTAMNHYNTSNQY